MKILKYLGIAVIGLVLVVLVLGIIAPSENHVERTVVIDASVDQVAPLVTSFEGMYKWSPWKEYDPNQTTTIENDGQVGARFTWDGNDSVGAGSQEITVMEANKVVTHLHFTRPFESEADATITWNESEEGVEVTWAYDDHTPYPMNAMNLMFNMDEMLGPDFQRGVDYLKQEAESMATEMESNEAIGGVTQVQLDGRTYLGRRATKGFDELTEFFASSFGEAFGTIQSSGMEMTGMPSAVYYSWNEEEMTTELLAGIPVMEGGSAEGLDAETVSGDALMLVYMGPYDGLMQAHQTIDGYARENAIPIGLVIEEYVTDPGAEPDANKWVTHLYYMIEDASASAE